MAIGVKTPKIDSRCCLEEKFHLIHPYQAMNAIYLSVNQVNLYHFYVCSPLNSGTKEQSLLIVFMIYCVILSLPHNIS